MQAASRVGYSDRVRRRNPKVSLPNTRTLLLLALSGLLLGLCGLPLGWSALTPIPLALALWLMAQGKGPGGVAGRAFWLVFVYFAVQLWWLTRFMADLSGLPLGGVLVLPLFAIEGAFWAVMAWLVTWPLRSPAARVWALAGGWVLLEWLRTLGPLAFPWGDLGYTLLPTPVAQTADLWGVLGLSLLVAFTAASLVDLLQRRYGAVLLASVLWAGGWVYGQTRSPADGPEERALVLRSQFDSFGRASGTLGSGGQFQHLVQLSQARQPGEIVVWSETAIQNQLDIGRVPAAGIYGVYQYPNNSAVSWDGSQVGAVSYDKLKPVPMGEYFPFETTAAGRTVWTQVFALFGLRFDPPPIGRSTRPLSLNGVLYGTYICYDSIFSWVARQQALNGAQVLVNISNDGWYKGWGVTQHFQMGRMRAIETRRWVIRSVNEGVAAAIDDLGRPVATLGSGEGVLHARYRLLTGTSPYMRAGDVPALLLALSLLLVGWRAERRAGRRYL
ncbi:apolipoprotein N-acyltransferase [Deinococcus radiomollis]|uniref:apolipoprotein N-acyltransferase n=1 Tax=Deinococcus radiomollis TaxID=468916 RepID=UPI003891AD92